MFFLKYFVFSFILVAFLFILYSGTSANKEKQLNFLEKVLYIGTGNWIISFILFAIEVLKG